MHIYEYILPGITVILCGLGFYWVNRLWVRLPSLADAHVMEVEKLLGKALHVETPLGSLDVEPVAGRDPNLESIPVYPGAILLDPEKPQYQMHFPGRGRHLGRLFLTPDAASVVADYYSRGFPDWRKDDYDTDAPCRYLEKRPGCQRAVTIRRVSKGTEIEQTVTYFDS